MTRKRIVLLVDIDGTLLTLHGAGKIIFQQTLHQLFGSGFNLQIPSFSGRTDWEIFLETWNRNTGNNPDWEPAWQHFRTEFSRLHGAHLSGALPVNVFPGVHSFFNRIAQHQSILSGLLTGNIRTNAWQKVRLTGLQRLFRFGAYGDDHWQRELLGPVALRRASRFRVNRNRDRIIVIGDSPRDMDVARYLGVESIGVTTGLHSVQELESAGATVVVSNLMDSIGFLNIPVDNRQ